MKPPTKPIELFNSEQQLEASSTAEMLSGAQAALVAAQDAAARAEAEANRLLDVAKRQVERARDAADAIALFANIGAGVRTICGGDPAPATEPVVLIQEPLHAAALMIEGAIAAILEDPSIDLEDDLLLPRVSIDSFAQWLSEPGNAERALPASKCVAAVASEEIRTVLAVRNGDAVYLIDPEPGFYGVDALFPDPGPQGPNRSLYLIARSLYLLAFALEGLVRNTEVLHPVPDGFTFAGGLGGDHIELRYRTKNAIATDAEGLGEWVERITGEIQKGGRVIVGDCRDIHSFDRAVYPKRWSNDFQPPTGVPIEVSEFRTGALCVTWKELTPPEWKTPYTTDLRQVNTRISCLMRWRDPDVKYRATVHLPVIPLDSDDVTVESLSKFIGSHQDPDALVRHGPLLARAITVLQVEEAAERGFLDAVAAAVASQHDLAMVDARGLATAHTKRWRRKNTKYRPLASANKSAFAEIVESISSELAISAMPVDEYLVTGLRQAVGAVWVGRRPNGDYVQVVTDDGVWAHIRTVTRVTSGSTVSSGVSVDEWQNPPDVGDWLPYWVDSAGWSELRLADRSRALTPPQKNAVMAAAYDDVMSRGVSTRIIAIKVHPTSRTVRVHSISDNPERLETSAFDFSFDSDGNPVLKPAGLSSTNLAKHELPVLFGVQRGGIRPLAEDSDVFAYLDREWVLAHWPGGARW